MSLILVDTSLWIDFFHGKSVASPLLGLIEANQLVTNDMILAELLPSITHRKEGNLRDLLLSIRKIDLSLDWNHLVEMQTRLLGTGHNHVGIPDLVIAQNALTSDLVLFENDRHFVPMKELFGLRLLRGEGGAEITQSLSERPPPL